MHYPAWSSQMGNPLMNESFLFNNPGFLTMLMCFGRFWRFYCKHPNRSKSFSMEIGFWEHLLWCFVNHAAKAMFQSCFKFQTKNTNIWWAFQTQDQSHFFRADGHVPSTLYGVNMLGLATCKNRKYTYNHLLSEGLKYWTMGELRMIGPQNPLGAHDCAVLYPKKRNTPCALMKRLNSCMHRKIMYIYVSLEPKWPLFWFGKDLVLKGSTTKIEDKQVPGIYIYMYILCHIM